MSAVAILRVANEHTSLTTSLDELHDAPDKLEKLIADLSELEKDIKGSKARIKASRTTVNHAKYKLDDMKASGRFWYTLRGKKQKFDEKLSAKEQEYYNALQAEEEAVNGEHMSTQLLLEARSSRSRLFQDVERYAMVRSELEALYESIFSGDTLEYVEEDFAEEQVKLAASTYTDLDTRLSAEKEVMEALSTVQINFDKVLGDLFGSYTAGYDRELIVEKARTALAESQSVIIQAQSIQPQLKMDDLELPSIWSRFIPEGFPKKTPDYERVELREKLRRTLKKMGAHVTVQKSWVEAIQSGVEAAEKEMTETKEELFRVRRAICERVINAGGDLPPEYNAME